MVQYCQNRVNTVPELQAKYVQFLSNADKCLSSVACPYCRVSMLMICHQSIRRWPSSRLSKSQYWLVLHQHRSLSASLYVGALKIFCNKIVVNDALLT